MSNKIPLSMPEIGVEELEAVRETLASGWYTHGPSNIELEKLFCEMIRCQYALSVNSCTSALELAIKANNISGEVIVPSFTWVSTANAVVTSGATPVFCDVDWGSRCVTAKNIEAVITPDTQAVIVVHFGGGTADMDDIVALCDARKIILIEDCAETIGGSYNQTPTGSFGIGCYSFFPTKNMTTGEGGMLTCNNQEFYLYAKKLAAHGLVTSTFDREKYDMQPWDRMAEIAGHNYRMSNILAAIGVVQFAKLEEMNARRRVLAHFYDERLLSLAGVELECRSEKITHTHQMYTVTVDPKIRNELVSYLRDASIEASVHFSPSVHAHPAYRNYVSDPQKTLKTSCLLSDSIISLPMYASLRKDEIERVVAKIAEYFAL